MKSMTRILVFTLALVMVLTTLPVFSPAKAEEITLQFWHWWSGPEEQYLLSILPDFTAATGIKVETLAVQDFTKIMTAIAGGTPPDLIMITNRAQLNEIASNGGAMELNEYMERDGVTFDDFLPSVAGDYTINGVVYGLPFLGFNQALYWNKEIFAEAGLDPEVPPATMEELAEYAKKLTVLNDDGSIARLGFNPNAMFMFALDMFGAKIFDEETGEFKLDSPEATETVEWMRSVNSELDPQEVTNFMASCGADLTADGAFESGRVAMEFNGCWKVAFNAMNVPDLQYGTAPMPTGEKHPEAALASVLEYNPHFVPSGSAHPEEAWQLIKWLCCDPEIVSSFAEFCANLSHLKTIPEGFEDGLLANPNFQIFIEQANSENAHPLPLYPYQNECDALINTAIEELMHYPELDVAETLANLNAELNALIG